MTTDSPLCRMYGSFDLFADAGDRHPGFVQLSAGGNWTASCPSVLGLLHRELDAGPTRWNYGRSAGPAAVTDALEFAEYEHNGRRFQPAVTVVNGTAEGAHLALSQLAADGRALRGSAGLMIGHGFPLYAHLCEALGFEFREVLNEGGAEPGYLPAMGRVVQQIGRDRPAVVFLIVPNNPIGECYPERDLRQLIDACGAAGATLLVDRVCLLPWDDYGPLARALVPLLAAGRCFVVDSLSKAESLAGLRVGFVVSGPADRDRLLHRTRERCLNPVTFSTLALAFTRLATLPDSAAAQDRAAAVVRGLHRERSDWADPGALAGLFLAFRAGYRSDLVARERAIRDNQRTLARRLGGAAVRPLSLDAGFNVALTLPAMTADRERSDQQRLAREFGVGVLTERCFRTTARGAGAYFVRLGLSIPGEQFARGVEVLGRYYGA
jgi:aspartate/methionine/tyrosine aminotransferase